MSGFNYFEGRREPLVPVELRDTEQAPYTAPMQIPDQAVQAALKAAEFHVIEANSATSDNACMVAALTAAIPYLTASAEVGYIDTSSKSLLEMNGTSRVYTTVSKDKSGEFTHPIYLSALKSKPVEANNDVLPCDVQLPGALLNRGVSISVLFRALESRKAWPESDTRLKSKPVDVAAVRRQAFEEIALIATQQKEYWDNKQRDCKALEDAYSENGDTYTPLGDDEAWKAGYANGHFSEACWLLGTIRALSPAEPKRGEPELSTTIAEVIAENPNFQQPLQR